MGLLDLLNAGEITAQIITFLILLFLMRIFVWKRFLKLLDDRKERIASELKDIEDAKSEVAKVKADYENKTAQIEAIARARIQEAVSEGKRLSEVIIENTKEDAEKTIENAKETIAVELANAKKELKDTVIDLTIGAAEKVIEARLTEKEDKKVIEDFLKGVDKL